MEKTIEELEQERNKLYDKIHAIDNKIREKKIDEINLNYEGKYIKYKSDFGTEHYCYVTDIMRDRFSFPNFDVRYLIRGLGFNGDFTGYGDATNFYWSYWYEFNIYAQTVDEFKKKTDSIVEITKEEFDKEFYAHVENVMDYYKNYSYDN